MDLLEFIGDKPTAGSRNLQLRILQAHARQWFLDCLDDRPVAAGRDKILTILDTHFSIGAVDELMRVERLAAAQVEPLCALLEGIVAGTADRGSFRAAAAEQYQFAVGNCIGGIIALTATARKFTNLEILKDTLQGNLTQQFLASLAEEFGLFCRRNSILLSCTAAALGRMQVCLAQTCLCIDDQLIL
jgi:hypothetical protein